MQAKFNYIVFLYLGALVNVNSTSLTDATRYIKYIDGDTTYLIDLLEAIDPTVLLMKTPQDSEYLLFTQKNEDTPQYIYTNNASSISSSNYNASVPTVVLVHGWKSSSGSDFDTTIIAVLLNKSDVNIIVVDWSWLAKYNYVTASYGVRLVGQALAKLLAFLCAQTGAKYIDIHLIGFSLGGHIVGIAGRSLDTKVARITALDPAGPLWYGNDECVQITDACYVEAIHTDTRLLGIKLNVGHTDFYPNGGCTQPGCIDDGCSHKRSWQYFGVTVTKDDLLIGHNCGNDLNMALNLCNGKTLPMGNNDLKKTGTGVYRVKVTSTSPYNG